jgi:ATP-dependent Clp protease ATP-binding subunit ClpC
VFERFTERAQQVVVLAQGEARSLKHNYIGTEHILLGLFREEEGVAARTLELLQARTFSRRDFAETARGDRRK